MNQAVKDGLIVALDIESPDDALAIFEDLCISVGMFKVGMQLFIAAVPDLVRQIVGRSGGSVFLNYFDPAKGASIRAAASTQPLCISLRHYRRTTASTRLIQTQYSSKGESHVS